MKKLIIFCVATFTLLSCENNKEIYADFYYNDWYTVVEFTNVSSGLVNYSWSFGDGKTSNEQYRVQHEYKNAGKYTCTLTGFSSTGKKYTCSKSFTLEAFPQTIPVIHMIGYKLYKIPYNNKYYKVTIAATFNGYEKWGRGLIYSPILSSADLPYTYMLQNKILLEEYYADYHTIYVHWSNIGGEDEGTQCLKQFISDEVMENLYKNRQREYILTSDNGSTKIGILFEYQ